MRYDLKRFKDAQERVYEKALKEIRNGHKDTHWIWYIFPQLKGLGYSSTSNYYGITSKEEAEAYFNDPLLSARLRQIAEALLELEENDPVRVLGGIDAQKLQSSMTLFDQISGHDVFEKVLDKFYRGERDRRTLEMLK